MVPSPPPSSRLIYPHSASITCAACRSRPRAPEAEGALRRRRRRRPFCFFFFFFQDISAISSSLSATMSLPAARIGLRAVSRAAPRQARSYATESPAVVVGTPAVRKPVVSRSFCRTALYISRIYASNRISSSLLSSMDLLLGVVSPFPWPGRFPR